MAQETKLSDVIDQVQMYWSPRFTAELRADLLLGGQVNKEYEGEIKNGGDRVRVSQVIAPQGQNLDAQSDDSFDAEKLQTVKVDVIANKRAVAAYKFHDIVEIQSLITRDSPKVMESLRYAMSSQINNYLYSLVNPTNVVSSVTSFGASQLQNARLLAGQLKWIKDGSWFLNLDPTYYSQIMGVVGLTSRDYVDDRTVQTGDISTKRLGFQIYEDNSRSQYYGLAAHPDFMHLVTQTQVQIKISDLHPLGQFGYLMSVDMIYGAALGIDGNKKHVLFKNT